MVSCKAHKIMKTPFNGCHVNPTECITNLLPLSSQAENGSSMKYCKGLQITSTTDQFWLPGTLKLSWFMKKDMRYTCIICFYKHLPHRVTIQP